MAESVIPLNTEWPFSEAKAKQLQEETAAVLNIPKELKIKLSEDVEMAFVLIPAGEFFIGSTQERINQLIKEERDSGKHGIIRSQGAQRRIRISRPFYMSRYETTRRQWYAVMDDQDSETRAAAGDMDNPVNNISWQDVTSKDGFLDKLNVLPKEKSFPFMQFRLPTEAEWEYSCRAGASDDFGGDGILDNMGWYKDNSGGQVNPVGMKTPNAFGLFDMHGNVAELCVDIVAHMSYRTGGEWIDPIARGKVGSVVVRGGAWDSIASNCRSAWRIPMSSNRGVENVGFRIAMSIFTPETPAAEYKISPGVDPNSQVRTTYTFDGLTYIGTPSSIDRLVHAMNLLYRNQGNYDHSLFWRETIKHLALAPASAKVPGELEIQAGDHIVQRMKELEGVFYPGPTRVLQEQLWLKQQAADYNRDDMVAYLESILPYWEGNSGRNKVLLTLAGLHSDNLDKSMEYYRRVATDRGAPSADRWGMDIQGAWKAMAKIYEERGEYGKAIEAVSNWHVSEPCGTGAGGSKVSRWIWMLGLRVKNGESIDELKEYAWQSLRTGEVASIWHPKGVADCLIELYENNYDTLLADANKMLAMLEAEENEEEPTQWRREEVMGVLNHISLRMRLAGPEWRMTAEEARDRQKKQADSFPLPIEKTVMFGEVPLVLMFIPAGEFLIGSPPDENGRIPPDEDQDRVRISRPFYLGKYEVTQLQWQTVMGGSTGQFNDRPDRAMRPVDSVSWNQIVDQFLPKIQKYAPSGMRFDLPTEAQWEYACRAGSDTPFHYGETPNRDFANIGGIDKNDNDRLDTMPVGSFPANAWGLHDMHGNVKEWCKDAFSHHFYRSHKAVAVDPVNKDGDARVIRGIWYPAPLSRSAFRSRSTPNHGSAGFRLALVNDEKRKNETEQSPGGDVLKAAPQE